MQTKGLVIVLGSLQADERWSSAEKNRLGRLMDDKMSRLVSNRRAPPTLFQSFISRKVLRAIHLHLLLSMDWLMAQEAKRNAFSAFLLRLMIRSRVIALWISFSPQFAFRLFMSRLSSSLYVNNSSSERNCDVNTVKRSLSRAHSTCFPSTISRETQVSDDAFPLELKMAISLSLSLASHLREDNLRHYGNIRHPSTNRSPEVHCEMNTRTQNDSNVRTSRLLYRFFFCLLSHVVTDVGCQRRERKKSVADVSWKAKVATRALGDSFSAPLPCGFVCASLPCLFSGEEKEIPSDSVICWGSESSWFIASFRKKKKFTTLSSLFVSRVASPHTLLGLPFINQAPQQCSVVCSSSAIQGDCYRTTQTFV